MLFSHNKLLTSKLKQKYFRELSDKHHTESYFHNAYEELFRIKRVLSIVQLCIAIIHARIASYRRKSVCFTAEPHPWRNPASRSQTTYQQGLN